MLSLCFRCLPFSFVLSLVLDVDGGDPLAALLKQLQAVLRSVRHLHWDLICVPGQNVFRTEMDVWPSPDTTWVNSILNWEHLRCVCPQPTLLGEDHREEKENYTKWTFHEAHNLSRDRPSSDAFNTRDVVWLVQHVEALPPFSPELPPLRTSVIWSGHSCALLLTYIIVSSR